MWRNPCCTDRRNRGFKIISETGVASGVRRIEALTGAQAINESQIEQGKLLKSVNTLKRSHPVSKKELSN